MHRLTLLALALSSLSAVADETLAKVPAHCARIAAVAQKSRALLSERSARAMADGLAALRTEYTSLEAENRELSERFKLPAGSSARASNHQALADQFQAERCALHKADDALLELSEKVAELQANAREDAQSEGDTADRLERAADPVAANAPLREKAVELQTEPGEVIRMYMTVAKERFVFVRRPVGKAVPRGEAVLISQATRDDQVRVTTLDGQQLDIAAADLARSPLPAAPVMKLSADRLTVQGADGAVGGYDDLNKVDDTGFGLRLPRFLNFAPDAPGVDAFMTQHRKTVACYEKEMGKLDPDGLRSYFALVKGERVERLSERFDRQVCAQCRCKALNEAQRKLAKLIVRPLQQKELERYEPAVKRVQGLFAPAR